MHRRNLISKVFGNLADKPLVIYASDGRVLNAPPGFSLPDIGPRIFGFKRVFV
jgi:hypothetical protein